ncbi:MAG: DUF2281 domain-containing protein [Anaerolineae bacterium]
MLKESGAIYNIYPQLDIFKLPEIARQELLDFYEFLLKKYSKEAATSSNQALSVAERRKILRAMFQEIHGELPPDYKLDREALHER